MPNSEDRYEDNLLGLIDELDSMDHQDRLNEYYDGVVARTRPSRKGKRRSSKITPYEVFYAGLPVVIFVSIYFGIHPLFFLLVLAFSAVILHLRVLIYRSKASETIDELNRKIAAHEAEFEVRLKELEEKEGKELADEVRKRYKESLAELKA